MTDVSFSEESVLELARKAAGLRDFGDEGFREGLCVLLETYEKTAGFSESGRRRNQRRVVQLLATRLRVEEAFKQHPEIRAEKIRRPLIVTGLPRSGTSALFNLLAADPAARPLKLWEAVFPDPTEGLAPGQSDPRRDALEAHYARGRERNPDFTKIHYVAADNPEECVLLLAHDFCDVQMGIEVMLEPYGSWFLRQDFRRTYAYYHELLKMLQWQRPGERWLLKAPAHMWAIDVLIENFPDVCIVWTHRDPLACIASACSMTEALMAGRESFDKRELGPAVMEFYATSLDRGLAARARSQQGRFIDVDYRGFIDDSLGVVDRTYEHFGLENGPPVVAAMRAHIDQNPKDRSGVHEYDLEEYGLSQECVLERFAAYTERFVPR